MSSSKSSGVSSSSVAEQTPGSAPNICHTCTEPITTPQFIRVGAYKFHKDHFTCSICSTSLHEKKFHHKDSKFYCADDYVNKFCHTCRHCKQKIATGSVIQAFDGYYHPEHFVCVECNRPFKNGKYYEANDQPYCDEHYFLLTAEKCQTCGLGVQEAEIVRVQGKVFHSHCLSCCHCGLPLAKKGSIFQKDGKTYCLAEDHQILTDQGFLFLDQVRKLQQSTDSTLRFASYDSHTQQLQYLPSSRLIDNPPDLSQSMVEFTSMSEAERWSDDADVYGRSASSNRKSSATSQLSLLVTGEHDMFVRRAGRVNHSKVLAKRLVNSDENISFLSCATGGLAAFENMEIPLAVELGLSTQEEIHALLAVYGAWIGFNLSVATPSSSPESIELPLSFSSSRTWLLRHFSSLRMIEGIDFQFTHTLCHIISRSYVNLFYTLPLDSLPSWVWQLGRSAVREMVDGWRQMTATPAEHDEITSHNQLRAYSTRSRDDAQRLCLHGGYATQFDVSPNTTDSSSLIWCITFFDSALAPLTAEPILQPGEIRSLEKGSYTGRTWCVTVPTGLIVVRRAATDIDGQVTKASQPTIIGNCRNDYLNFFCKRCTACAEHILKHCIAGGQSVNLVSGESRPIEHVDAETPILAHDGHGLIGASHEGVLLQPNERECVTLVFADGRSITCTPEHRVLTPDGYVPAESLTPGLSTVLTSVRFPSLTRPSSKEQRELEDSFQFESPVLSSIHMRDDFNRKRALAFARVAGYVFQQPTDEIITFTTHLDAVSFQRDIDLVMSTVETIDQYDSLTLTVALPSPVTSALLTILSPSSQFFHPLATPISIHRAFLSGRISRSGGIDIVDHQFTIRWPTDIAYDSMRSAQLESTTSPRILETALAFTYSSHQQERLAIAASYEGVIAHADKPTQTAVEYIQFTGSQSFFKELQLTDNHTHTHSHHTHRHHATHSSKLSSSYGTFELSLTSVSSAGFHSVYDVVNSAHESFQVEGVCVHNCVSVNDEYYHPACLVCSHCGCKLDKYISISGYLRCNEHTELPVEPVKCSVCTKIVDGEVVLSVGKKVHPECFKCQLCGAGLQKATAKLKDDKLCCNDCMMKRDPSLMAKNAAAANGVAPEGETPIQVDSRPSTSSTTSAAAGVAVSSPKPIDHDEFTKYEKPTRSRKPSKALPQGKIEWKKGELIGKGSFGKVYMAMNSATGELIAVKQVRLNTAEEQEQAAAIQNEIGLMENLRHPNIVSLLGTQRNGNKLNILMEYVPGKSLDSLLEKFGGFSEKVIRSYTKQLLEALAYCHANRVVHRDIKGKNILVNTQGNLKLADFGSAKRFTNVMSKDAPSLSYNYTPLWTAPEVLTGDYNSKVDIWSLGCVIIEMSSAKPPWSEQNFENPFRALYHIGNSDAIPKIPETLSETGINFVKQCLRRNPDERPDAAYLLKQEWLSGIESLPNNSDDSSSDGEDHASDSD